MSCFLASRGMDQFTIQLRGSINPWRWSERVFSIFPRLDVVSLSAAHHPEKWSHRSLRVTNVQLWPHYNRRHVRLHFDSMEAKLTLRVCGDAVQLRSSEVHRHGRTSSELGFQQSNSRPKSCAWMVRFSTFQSLEKAVRLLAQFEPRSVEGDAIMPDDSAQEVPSQNGVQNAPASPPSIRGNSRNDSVCLRQSTLSATDNPFTSAVLNNEVRLGGMISGDVESDLNQLRAQWKTELDSKLLPPAT